MPAVHCKKCGATTNSAISEYWMRDPFIEGEADGCYAKFNYATNEYERGCLHGNDEIMTRLADSLINRYRREATP